MSLTQQEYKTIFHFLQEIQVPFSSFRKKVQESLAELFDYNVSLFWLTDNEGNIYNPEVLNYSDKAIEDYLDYFYQYDLLHTDNLKAFPNQSLVPLKSLISYSDHENSYYYANYAKEHNFYDELAIYLKYGGKPCGVIGLTKRKNEGFFTHKDYIRLQHLSSYVSHLLYNLIQLEEIESKTKIYAMNSHLSEVGLIEVDHQKNVRFMNGVFKKICKELDNELTILDFLEKYIFEHKDWKAGIKIEVHHDENKKWMIKTEPKMQNPSNYPVKRYNIYLLAEEKPHDITGTESLLSQRELEICELVMKGYSNKQIAEEFWVSINTVKKHLSNIYKKLQVNNRTSLVFEMNCRNMKHHTSH